MKNQLMLILILLTLTLQVLAESVTPKYIRSSVFELEGQISKNLEDQISQFSGLEKIWIAVRLDVSTDELVAHLERDKKPVEPKKKNKYEDLPGLSFGNSLEVEDGSDRSVVVIDQSKLNVDVSSILAFTRNLEVTVYHIDGLDKKVERLIRSLVEEKIVSLNIPVNVKFNHRRAKPLQNVDLDPGQKVRLESDHLAKGLHHGMKLSTESFFESKMVKGFAFGLGFFFFAVVCVGLFFGYKSITTLNRTLEVIAKNILNHSPASASAIQPVDAFKESHANTHATSSSELDCRQMILDIHEGHAEVITNFFMNALENKEFQDIWALSQVLGDKLVFENISISKGRNFGEYINFLKDNLHQESGLADYKKLYQKLMGLMLYPNVFFLNNIKKSVAALSLNDLAHYFETLSSSEKGVVAELVEPLRLAPMMNQNLLSATDFLTGYKASNDLHTLKKLEQKTAQFTQSLSQTEDEKLLLILSYLNQDQFNAHILKWEMSEGLLFDNLFQNKKTESFEFFKALNVEELCALLPMLSPSIQGDIEAILPELKLARIHQAGKKISEMSSPLMSAFFKILIDKDIKSSFLSELPRTLKKDGLSIAG